MEREALDIPVYSNGNIREYKDVVRCMEEIKVDGVMSAEGLLNNPAIFCETIVDPFDLSREYLDICEKYPTIFVWKKNHVYKILNEP